MTTVLHTPSHVKHPESLVIAPYPFAGTPANTSSRFQAIAEFAGVNILGVQATGTGGRVIIDLATRRTTTRNFSRTCAIAAEQFKPYTTDYEQLIGWGDSARGSNVMRMQLESGVFDKLLLRDPSNLSSSDKFKRLPRLAGYFSYLRHEAPLSVTVPEDLPPVPGKSVGTVIAAIGELASYTTLLATETARDARELASVGDLTMRCVFLSDSFTGNHEEAMDFAKELANIRNQSEPKCPLEVDVIMGSHNHLMRPRLAAEHIQQTIEL